MKDDLKDVRVEPAAVLKTESEALRKAWREYLRDSTVRRRRKGEFLSREHSRLLHFG